jgi:hypothetical protein
MMLSVENYQSEEDDEGETGRNEEDPGAWVAEFAMDNAEMVSPIK